MRCVILVLKGCQKISGETPSPIPSFLLFTFPTTFSCVPTLPMSDVYRPTVGEAVLLLNPRGRWHEVALIVGWADGKYISAEVTPGQWVVLDAHAYGTFLRKGSPDIPIVIFKDDATPSVYPQSFYLPIHPDTEEETLGLADWLTTQGVTPL